MVVYLLLATLAVGNGHATSSPELWGEYQTQEACHKAGRLAKADFPKRIIRWRCQFTLSY